LIFEQKHEGDDMLRGLISRVLVLRLEKEQSLYRYRSHRRRTLGSCIFGSWVVIRFRCLERRIGRRLCGGERRDGGRLEG
jgi:hypothetical protein